MIALVACSFVACAGNDDPSNNSHANAHTETTSANNATTNNALSTNNTTTPSVDTYVDGLSKVGPGGVTFTLVSAEPAPPDVGENTWTIRILDPDGAPVDGAEVVVAPFMPAHNHGTSPADYSGAFIDDGTYVAGPFDLIMPGTWEMTVTLAGESGDSVVFIFALEG